MGPAISPVIGLSRAVGAPPPGDRARVWHRGRARWPRWLLTAPSPVSCDLTAATARSAATSSALVVVARAGAGVELLADAQRPLAVAETAAEGFIGPGRAVVGGERHEPRPARRSRRSTCPRAVLVDRAPWPVGRAGHRLRHQSGNLSPLGGW